MSARVGRFIAGLFIVAVLAVCVIARLNGR